MSRVVVVAPLKEDAREEARRLVDQGPPFDPASFRLVEHHVYLTDREAIFVFDGPDARELVDRIANDPDVWRAVPAWRDVLAARPRIAEELYAWPGGG